MTVSVVVPSYNHQRFLREALDSVFAQTLPPDEVVVIDDASSDGSPAIARSYEDRAEVVLFETNRGTYPTLNAAIERVSSEWVAILNSDDAWEPSKLAEQTAALDGEEFSFTNGHFVDADGAPCEYHTFGRTLMRAPSGPMMERLVYHNYCFPSTVMFRRSLWERAGRFRADLQCLGDWDLFLRMAELTPFRFVDKDLVRYRVHGGQTSTVRMERMNREEMEVRETRIHSQEARLLSLPGDRAVMRRALSHSAAALGTRYHLLGNAGQARRLYLHSLRLNPLRGKSLLRLLLAVVTPRISKP